MSNSIKVPQQPPKSDREPPEKEKIEIPAWWSIVALIMAALVFLPIQYANTHGNKPVAQEGPQATPAEVASKPAAEQEAPPAKQAVEQAAGASKPAAEQEPPPAKQTAEEAKPAAEAPPAKQVEHAAAEAPQPKDEHAEHKQAAVEAAAPKQGAEQAEAKPAATQGSEANQKVALLKEPAEKQKVEDAVFYRIEGKDSEGRAAAFDFIILTNDYTWAKGSSSQVAFDGKVIPEKDTADRLLAPKVRDSLANASDVIAVGLASKDGERSEEEARAAARSKTVATWIKKVAKPEIALWTLTLGQYEKACKEQEDKDSSFERPVLFIGVRSKAEGANLQEALADAISGHENLPSRECYSRFDMAKIR